MVQTLGLAHRQHYLVQLARFRAAVLLLQQSIRLVKRQLGLPGSKFQFVSLLARLRLHAYRGVTMLLY